MQIGEICSFFDQLLELEKFAADPSNNGLQLCFDSTAECGKIAFAVDAALATAERAAAENADLLVVHHGLSWGGGLRRWNGMAGKRLGTMFKNDLSLYAVHLPLDAHSKYGNNAVLANMINLEDREMFFAYHNMDIGIIGNIADALEPEVLAQAAAGRGKDFVLCKSPLKDSPVRRVAVISGGGGADGLESAVAAGADMLITGEFDHTMYHTVQECPIHVAALGHYNSEVHGVQSLQKLVQEKFGTDTVFIDVPTGF